MKVNRYKALERLFIMKINQRMKQDEDWRIQKRLEAKAFCNGLRNCLKMATLVLVMLTGCSALGHASNVVQIAESQIGKGEQGGDNKGSVVKMYCRGRQVSWCAGFVSYCLLRAGRGHGYLLRALSYWQDSVGVRVKSPKPGDVVVFSRGNGKGHVGIVEAVQGKTITTIEGNVGRYPAKVKRITYTIGKIPNLIGFVRI